jgi:molecular chaperone HscB
MDQSHFERLGLPRRFSVDPTAIEREYLTRSRAVHPDFHQLGTAAEQRASLEQTAALNEAYLTLKEPFRRAEYLLGLMGGPSAQAEKNLDQAFLLEMMELRERIEDARAAHDAAATSAIEAELTALQTERLAQVATHFERVESLSADDPARGPILVQIRRLLNAVKTIRSLLRDLQLD